MIDNSHIYSNKIINDINHFSINFILRLCKTIVVSMLILQMNPHLYFFIKNIITIHISMCYIKYAKKSIKLTERMKNVYKKTHLVYYLNA